MPYNAVKEAKKRKRQKKERIRQRILHQKAAITLPIVFHGNYDDSIKTAFVNLINSLTSNIRYQKLIKRCKESTERVFQKSPERFLCIYLFSQLPEEFKRQYLLNYKLFYYIYITTRINIYIKKIKSFKGPNGRILYSNATTSDNYIIGFSQHFIKRLIQRLRLVHRYFYITLEHVYSILSNNECITFQDITINGERWIQLWIKLFPETRSYRIATKILGHKPNNKQSILVGYCPTVQHGNILLLKTLNPPGYRGTPERVYGHQSDHLTDEEVQQKCCWQLASIHDDYSLLRQFHYGGFIQIKEITD